MFYLGIDLGGTNIVAGVVDGDYNIICTAECKTNAPRPAESICDSMAQMAFKALEKANITIDDIEYVGIGVPGGVNPITGLVEFSPNLDFNNTPIGKFMEDRLSKKVILENDANAAALGEFMAGSAKGATNAVAITLGTGVGGGIIIDGKIYSGSNFSGAELGHTVIEYGGWTCGCGRKGCFEAYASASGLIKMTKEAILKEDPETSVMYKSIGGDINKVSGLTSFNAMREGDEGGKAVVDKFISYLACGVTNTINIFQPDILCIGGGISREGETLLAPLREIVEKDRCTKLNEKQTKIVAATLGNGAGIIGAALLGVSND